LAEHSDAITKWRNRLPERQKRRLIHPLSVTRRWKASLAHDNSKSPQDLKRNAAAAWRRFVNCVEALPAEQAVPLWQMVQAQAMESKGIQYLGNHRCNNVKISAVEKNCVRQL
jgi:hypothetical protein